MSETGSFTPSSTLEYQPQIPTAERALPSRRYWLHGILLLATCFTTLVVGARLEFNFEHNFPLFTTGNEHVPFFPIEWALAHPSRLLL